MRIRTQTPPIWGREKDIAALRARMSASPDQCLILMGPEGIGKTTLLRHTFTREYRLQLAREGVITTAVTPYDPNMSYNAVYSFFTDILMQACLELLPQVGDTEALAEVQGVAAQNYYLFSPEAKLQGLVRKLQELGCQAVLVLDDFEKFTASRTVTSEHHDLMNGLVDNLHLRIVAATDFDLNPGSVSAASTGSYLIQKFGTGKVLLQGLDDEAARELAEHRLPDSPAVHEAARKANTLAGGNPGLLQTVLDCFDKAERQRLGCLTDRAYVLNELSSQCLEAGRRLLRDWCRLLTPQQAQVLEQLYEVEDNRSALRSAAWDKACAELEERGLLIREEQELQFAAMLLEMYFEGEHETSSDTHAREQERLLVEYLRTSDPQAAHRLFVAMDEDTQDALIARSLSEIGPNKPILESERMALGITTAEVEQLNQSSPRVCEMLHDGIRAARLTQLLDSRLMPYERPDVDYAASLFDFNRAAEAHLKDCIYPLLEVYRNRPASTSNLAAAVQDDNKRWRWKDGSAFRDKERKNLTWDDLEALLRADAGELEYQACNVFGLRDAYGSAMDFGWWMDLAQSSWFVRDVRNDCTHLDRDKTEPGQPAAPRSDYVPFGRARQSLSVLYDGDSLPFNARQNKPYLNHLMTRLLSVKKLAELMAAADAAAAPAAPTTPADPV